MFVSPPTPVRVPLGLAKSAAVVQAAAPAGGWKPDSLALSASRPAGGIDALLAQAQAEAAWPGFFDFGGTHHRKAQELVARAAAQVRTPDDCTRVASFVRYREWIDAPPGMRGLVIQACNNCRSADEVVALVDLANDEYYQLDDLLPQLAARALTFSRDRATTLALVQGPLDDQVLAYKQLLDQSPTFDEKLATVSLFVKSRTAYRPSNQPVEAAFWQEVMDASKTPEGDLAIAKACLDNGGEHAGAAMKRAIERAGGFDQALGLYAQLPDTGDGNDAMLARCTTEDQALQVLERTPANTSSYLKTFKKAADLAPDRAQALAIAAKAIAWMQESPYHSQLDVAYTLERAIALCETREEAMEVAAIAKAIGFGKTEGQARLRAAQLKAAG